MKESRITEMQLNIIDGFEAFEKVYNAIAEVFPSLGYFTADIVYNAALARCDKSRHEDVSNEEVAAVSALMEAYKEAVIDEVINLRSHAALSIRQGYILQFVTPGSERTVWISKYVYHKPIEIRLFDESGSVRAYGEILKKLTPMKGQELSWLHSWSQEFEIEEEETQKSQA